MVGRKKCPLPKAEGTIITKGKLLAAFLNSNSHGNGHTDHGVVTCAQEAHHLNVKSACRRLCACGAGTFGAGSPTFRKTRSTSLESGILCFPSTETSYHIMCSQNKTFELSWTSHHHLFTTTINGEHLPNIASSTHKKLFEKEEKRFRDRKGIGYLLRYNMAIKSEGNKDKNLSRNTKK